MTSTCPRCPDGGHTVVRDGHYFRRSDSRYIRRLKCTRCGRSFSRSSSAARARLRRRRLLPLIQPMMCSGMSQRRMAKLLNVSRNTLVRYFKIVAEEARARQWQRLVDRVSNQQRFDALQFDELHTIEHTKCKPVSVCVVVEQQSRFILGHGVARIPASGPLAAISRQKYGPRPDQSESMRQALIGDLCPYIASDARFSTDEHHRYGALIKRHFPQASHRQYKSIKGCVTGQGELKKTQFDPLFSVNHTLAMCRANINRLFRRSWCTSKRNDRLDDHLALYVDYHNRVLLNA